MKLLTKLGSRRLSGLGLVLGMTGVIACDSFEPSWLGLPRETVLYSLARTEFIGREGAFDFIGQRGVVVERTPSQTPFEFDVAVTEIDGVFHALPAGMFEGFNIRPGLIVDSSGISLAELTRAPRDGYETMAAVELRPEWVYVVQTRRDFRGCTMYSKFEVTSLDPAGLVTMRSVSNPLCNDRNLVPPGD
jgi:hypothetical protein